MKILHDTIRYIIFQYGSDPVLIQRILIGSMALLETPLLSPTNLFHIMRVPIISGPF